MELVFHNIEFLLTGAYYTLLITIVSMFFGLIIGIVVAIARLKGNRLVRTLAKGYVSLIRGTPILVQIFIIYYGLPDFGITLGPLAAAFISLSVNIGAYLSRRSAARFYPCPAGRRKPLSPWA